MGASERSGGGRRRLGRRHGSSCGGAGESGPERRQLGQVRGPVSVPVAEVHGLAQRGVRSPDAVPASRGVARDGDSSHLRRNLDGSEDGVRGYVAEGHIRRGLVVDTVGGTAGELPAEHGDALAECRAEALSADFQVDAGSAAELGETHQGGDDPVPPLLLLLAGVQGEFGNLVDQDDDRSRTQSVGQIPDVGGDLRVRLVGADDYSGTLLPRPEGPKAGAPVPRCEMTPLLLDGRATSQATL